MKKNPFLKVEQKIIKSVYTNGAVLHFNVFVKSYNTSTGEISEVKATYNRNVYIGNPKEISDFIVDGKNYMKGDLNVDVAYKQIVDIITPMDGDSTVIAGKTILDYRTPSGRDGGIHINEDTITFDGTEYSIVKITPKNFYGGVPSVLRILMRAL